MTLKQNLNKYLLVLLLANFFLGYAGMAYAQQDNPYQNQYDYSQGGTNPISSQIKKYLCAPTESNDTGKWGDLGNDQWVGYGQAGANNAAGNDLYQCINKLYKFAIAIASSVGILMIVVAGYLYMSSDGNQETVDKAKGILTSTITAIVILFAGYLILRTINPDLIAFKNVQPLSVRLTPTTAPTSETSRETQGVPAGTGGSCAEQSQIGNLCQPTTLSGCTKGVCSTYNSAITNAANKVNISGVNMQALLRAIMFKESTCDSKALSPAGSCGLMQLQPDTAKRFKSSCGAASETITCDWLKNNPDKSVCMAAYYLKELSNTCGTNIENLAAGYNGGATACQTSVTCSGEQGCTGAKKKWECLYNGPAGSRTTCNTGYTETRKYAPQVYYCYNQQF